MIDEHSGNPDAQQHSLSKFLFHMWQTFTREAREVIAEAMQVAIGLGQKSVSPDHTFLAILRQPQSEAVKALKRLGLDPSQAKAELETILLALPKDEKADWDMSEESMLVLDAAFGVGRKTNQRKLGSEHLLLAILMVNGTLVRHYLTQKGITYGSVRRELQFPGQVQEPQPRRETKALDDLFETILLSDPNSIREKLATISRAPQPIRNELMSLFLKGEEQ